MVFSTLTRLYQIGHPPAATLAAATEVPDSKPLKFGCLGAAKIAPGALVNPARTHAEVEIYAVAARDKDRADAFAAKHGFKKVYAGLTGYQDLINDPDVDVVYNPLPNGLHFEWTMKALHGGKHVLLEKPATNTAEEAQKIFDLAAKKNLVVLEAFHYRFHPAVQRMKAILDSEELGKIRSVTAALTAPEGTAKADDIRWDYNLGGGSTMDPGSYTVNILRYLASSNPTAVLSASAIPFSPAPQHKSVDSQFSATLSFENGVVGELHSNLNVPKIFGFIPRMPQLSATVRCERGTIEIFNFLIPSFYHYITIAPTKGPSRTEKAYSFNGKAKGEDWWTTYRYQLEGFVDKVKGRTPQTWVESEDTIANMKWIEEIYAKDGFGSRPKSHYLGEDTSVHGTQ